jgi:hypothetical protein
MLKLAAVCLTFAMPLTFASPVYSASFAKKFTNCAALNQTFPNGVVATKKLAELAVRDGYLKPRVNAKIAIANDALSPNLPYVCPRRVAESAPTPSVELDPEQSAQPNTIPEPPTQDSDVQESDSKAPAFETDPKDLLSIAYWPTGLTEPQVVEVEVYGPAKIQGLVQISGFSRQYGGSKARSWQKTLVPTSGGDLNGVDVYVSRDARQWPVPNARPLPKGDMGCRIRVNGQVVSEYKVSYAWKSENKVNLARCRITTR